MATKYQNLPVKTDVYKKVRLIADVNGLGLGAQVEQWVARELPDCEHEKTPVEIELFPSQDMLPGTRLDRTGWYCPTCKRVYQRIELPVAVETNAQGGDSAPAPVKKRKAAA
ncbi:MAG: hypothetical protein EDM79_20530 [Chloroflexi bacterium]|nr:MAG: hypothetical protein EDM79_20530 [Chloroflexota bacterium]